VWDIPGGHVEPGEIGAKTIVRELHEELGIAVSVSDEPFAVLESEDRSLSIEVWRIESWEGTPTNRATDEHDRIAWFALEEAIGLQLADESYRPLLARAVRRQSI
jgi:mutator protein MutT